MRTSMQFACGVALAGLVALLAGIPIGHAAGKTPPTHRYSISGSLAAVSEQKTAASTPLALSGRLSAASNDAGLQAGGDFVVMAKLAESPQGCSGGDTIFADDFDP